MKIFRVTFKSLDGINDVQYIAASDAVEALSILQSIRRADGTPLVEHDGDTPLVEYLEHIKIEEVES